MRIKSVHIRGLKNLSDIEISFGADKDATLIFANNGVGKTTILEAMSLIGHVSCMRKLLTYTKSGKLVVEQQPSKLCREIGQNVLANDDKFNPLKSNIETYGSLQQWFDAVNRQGGDAAIRYVLDLSDPIKNVQLYIFVRRDTYNFDDGPPRPVTITKALSRQYPDDEINDLMAIVADGEDQGAKVDELINQIFDTRSHILKGGKIRKRKRKAVEALCGIVSYINTDLNDFGKGNDLRETPKDIAGDLPREVIDRLEIPFSVQAEGTYHEFDFLEDVNTHLAKILNKYPHFDLPRDPRDKALEALFRIQECKYSENEGRLRFSARRRGKLDEVPLDYMSAGENECFFLFLMVHGLIAKKSIVLLDEPELHLSTFTQRVFFRELLSILKHKECQVVVATHSGVALVPALDTYHREERHKGRPLRRTNGWEKAKIEAKFIRVNPNARKPGGSSERDFLVDWPKSFPVHLYFHYLSTAWLCLSVANVFVLKVLMARVYLFHQGYQQSGTDRKLLWTCVGLFATSLVPVIVLVISDYTNLFDKQTLKMHGVVIDVVGPFSLVSFGLLILCALYLAWRGRGQ